MSVNAGAVGSADLRRKALALPDSQVILFLVVWALGSGLILVTIQEASYAAVGLLGAVGFAGLVLCKKTEVDVGDSGLRLLGYFWLIKLSVTLIVLYAGWIPQLDPATSPAWGYDPQRYYLQAQALITNHWVPDFLSLNYVGILYYYGGIFYLFGHNPVVPAVVNCFVTLIATLYLVRVWYEVQQRGSTNDWMIACALLLPEVLWYDVTTSRETLMAALLVFALLTTGRYVVLITQISSARAFTMIGVASVAIAAVRTSMVLPVVASIGLLLLFVKTRSKRGVWHKAVLAASAIAALVVALGISRVMGGYGLNLNRVARITTSAQENIALSSDVTWSENSIGMLLMPEGVLESILFTPARMVLYLIAPLPRLAISISAMSAGSWSAWQRFFTLPSSIINLLAIPYVLAGSFQAVRSRKKNAGPLIFAVAYWTTFSAIVAGNLVIHERYRVMASILGWACACLGAKIASRRLVAKCSVAWYGLLAIGVVGYVIRKGI